MKKNIINLLIFTCVILLLFGLSYQLNKTDSTANTSQELSFIIEGGGKVVKNNIKKITIFKDKEGELKYMKLIHSKPVNKTELYNLDRIINISYNPKIKDKVKVKPLSQLELGNNPPVNE